jgi:2-polyprenyl-3-methyl-5-hydroxy-6-metoxy-1,4-benzoquinol methylase
MKPSNTVSKHYKGDLGRAYVAARQYDAHHPGFGLNFDYFRKYIDPSSRVLDFGCGNGGMLPHIARAAASVEAVEVNPVARDLAKGFEFPVYESIDAIPAGKQYDVIVSNHVLEHVPNVIEVLSQLRRHLVPGGLFITKLPIDDIRESLQRSWSKEDVDRHFYTWTPRLFANVLFEGGYEVQSIEIITSAWNRRFFPLIKLGLAKPAFWCLATILNRRQLLAVARA